MATSKPKYTMKISRLTVDKLGVKLYDRVHIVLSELIANSYDADAHIVKVCAPMNQYLATKKGGVIESKNQTIVVEDDGIGMTPQELQDYYLVVGKERRTDKNRGDKSRIHKRDVMGRKGVGKLAPFGICKKIEVISAGGEKTANGYLTAHIILKKDDILTESDYDYEPEIGERDGSYSDNTFTKIVLSDFYYRKVPDIILLGRQISQRFGIESADWRVELFDANKIGNAPDRTLVVGDFVVDILEHTKIKFSGPSPTLSRGISEKDKYCTINPDDSINTDIECGFTLEERFFPLTGWIGYSTRPYKDDLMAGVRVYCRGKIAAQTLLFEQTSGFTGEYSIRSYLVGKLDADWLDEEEDLIQTDRRDILWSHELGEKFKEWGQSVIKQLGQMSRAPMRQSSTEQFLEIGNVENSINERYPSPEQADIRKNAIQVAKLLGSSMRGDELEDATTVRNLVDLAIVIAPLKSLDEKLNAIASTDATPLRLVIDLLKTARVAEFTSLGHNLSKRLEIIDKLEKLKDSDSTDEMELQRLITVAPWLIDPQWVPLTFNQSFTTFMQEFKKYYKEQTGQELIINDFSSPKRPDFILFNQLDSLQLIDIKKPKYKIANDDMERIANYFNILDGFLNDSKNSAFKAVVPRYAITLICDGDSLSGSNKAAFDSLQSEKRLTVMSWASFLLRTKQTHQEFLQLADSLGIRND